MLGTGDVIYNGELISISKDQRNFAELRLPHNWTTFIDPGTAMRIDDLHEIKPRPEREFSYYKSTIRVIKGFIRTIVYPDGIYGTDHYNYECVLCTGGVHGTELEVSVVDGVERFTCVEGQIWVEHPREHERIILNAGQYAVATEEEITVHTLSPGELAAAQARMAELGDPSDGLPAQADGAKYIHATNGYSGTITAYILWHQTDDTWHRVKWRIPGNAAGYLVIDGERVRADTVMHWAESEDGKVRWRSSEKREEIDISGTEGDTYTITYGGLR
jgi:hypothetical protein